MRSRLPSAVAALAAAVLCSVLAPAVAGANTVVADTQVVKAFQCLGPLCADGEAMSGPQQWIKNNDTPAIRLFQGNGAGYTAQTWDVGANEVNFFVRDLTSGSRLPFRVRPGAPTSGIDLQATGTVNTENVVQQRVSALTTTTALDGDAALAALRTLVITRYTTADGTHAAPASFASAFGLGADGWLAPQDTAAVALAAVKALDARVSGLQMTPGPKGEQGAAGAAGAPGAGGAKGEKGDAGAAGAPGTAADVGAANARIAALEKSNAKLAKSLAALQKQVRSLSKRTKKARAAGSGSNGR